VGAREGGVHREIVFRGAVYCATLSLKREKISLSSCAVAYKNS